MTDNSDWDPTGEVATELRNAVEIYGDRALLSRQLLANFFSDPFPKGNKGASLLVSGAEAGVAASLRRHMDEGLDADNAVMLAGREFEDARPVPAGSGLWVATQMASVMRIPVSDRLAERSTSPQPVPTPVGPTPWPVGPSAFGPPPQPDPVVQQPAPSTQPPSAWESGATGDHQANLGQRPTIGAPGTPPPSPVPPSGPTGGGNRSNRTLMIVAGAIALVVIVYLGVAAASHIAPFSKSSTTTTITVPPTPAPTPAPTTPTTLGVPTLSQLMPDQNSSDPLLVSTDCQTVSPVPTGLTGVTTSFGCSVPGQEGWELFGYQFDNSSDYSSSVSTYLNDKVFDPGQADSNCPPTGNFQEGQIGWNDQSYPAANGQNLQCLTFQDLSNSNLTDPAYIWELPSRNTIFEVIGSSSSTFSQMDSWWTDNGYPSA